MQLGVWCTIGEPWSFKLFLIWLRKVVSKFHFPTCNWWTLVHGVLYILKFFSKFSSSHVPAEIVEGYKIVTDSAEEEKKSQRSLSAQLEAIADMKFTYVATCQIYGNQKLSGDRRATDILNLMVKYVPFVFVSLSLLLELIWYCHWNFFLLLHSHTFINKINLLCQQSPSISNIQLVWAWRIQHEGHYFDSWRMTWSLSFKFSSLLWFWK